MYPVLPFGPMTIPTGPIIILIATTIGLEIAGRYGRRLGISVDTIWNIGLIAILAGLIVARLWNVIQFWPVYIAEPWLIVSVRPSGFAPLPGFLASVIAIYAYMIRHALAPAQIIAALAVGTTIAAAIIQGGMLLTGTLVGVESDLPWALAYFGEQRHPIALYYTVGFSVIGISAWIFVEQLSPPETIALLFFSCGIVYLLFAPYEYQPWVLFGWRIKQVGGFIVSLLSVLWFARHRQSMNTI